MSWDDSSSGGWDDAAASGASWGTDNLTSEVPQVSKAPVQWLWAGIAFAIVAVILAFLTNNVWFFVVGWVLAGFVAIIFLGVFFSKDTARRAAGWAEESSAADVLRKALVVIAFIAIVANSWFIADVLARSEW